MTSQAVEGTWIHKAVMGGSGANGLMEKKTNAIIPCQNHRFVVPNWTKKIFARDLILPFLLFLALASKKN